jgi:hypothetical protein
VSSEEMTNEKTQLQKVYNNNERIINAGFMMQSNYILPVLSRMKGEGLINDAGATVVQAILSFKHTEENPFPTRETIAMYLGKGIDYVKKALKSIKKSGVLAIEKSGRKSTYNFKPFFALIEKFIVEFKEKKNFAVKITDLLKAKVQPKEEKDFSWSEEYNSEKEVVAAEPTEEVQEEVEEVVPSLPEGIAKVAEVYNVDTKGMEAIEKAYNAYSDKLHDNIFIEKITASVGKNGFANYFTKCITNAFINNEQPEQAAAPKSSNKGYNRKVVREEQVPEWLNNESKKEETNNTDDFLREKEELERELAEYNAKKEGAK